MKFAKKIINLFLQIFFNNINYVLRRSSVENCFIDTNDLSVLSNSTFPPPIPYPTSKMLLPPTDRKDWREKRYRGLWRPLKK